MLKYVAFQEVKGQVHGLKGQARGLKKLMLSFIKYKLHMSAKREKERRDLNVKQSLPNSYILGVKLMNNRNTILWTNER